MEIPWLLGKLRKYQLHLSFSSFNQRRVVVIFILNTFSPSEMGNFKIYVTSTIPWKQNACVADVKKGGVSEGSAQCPTISYRYLFKLVIIHVQLVVIDQTLFAWHSCTSLSQTHSFSERTYFAQMIDSKITNAQHYMVNIKRGWIDLEIISRCYQCETCFH